jgi:anti-anti-sigma factor
MTISQHRPMPDGSTVVWLEKVQWSGCDRVSVIGEIDVSNVNVTETTLASMARKGQPLTLDLVGLTYLDSQGIAMILRLAQRLRTNGGMLTLANPCGIVERVLTITNIGERVPITVEM